MSTIKDGLELPGRKVEIPNCMRRELPAFFVEMGYKKGVEVGTYKGDFTRWFAKKGLEIYTIDPYIFTKDYHPDRIDIPNRQEEIYRKAQKKLAKYKNAHLIRKTSMEALHDFEDESLDFVYIDGHHGLKYVTEDIYGWSFKVRKGGVISGHDYALRRGSKLPGNPLTMHSKIAVDAYVQAFEIKKWYVLGRNDAIKGEVREKFRSWFWFKE